MRIIKVLSIAIAFTASINTINCQELKTKLDSAAYVMGSQMGEYYFLNQIEINVDAFVAGLRDGYKANRVKIQEPQKSEVMKAFEEYMQQKQQEKSERDAQFNKEVAKSILEQNRQNKDIKETSTGLQYQVIKEGTGKKPVATDKVKVHYVGTLFNGTVFDSSRERKEPITFGLSQVIPGWTEGLQLMTEGSIYKFWIPSELGYGNRATGSIPAGSLLIFEVELLEVNPTQ
jgi:FKBP-type peptidyl-prolyl cis-trans isomerase FklB